jgi:hypothetical protein
VFEIGNSLREARLRQNLDFTTVEAATKIRSKYVQALEAERFDVLPAETYVKGFLRTYAEYLGLDGQLYVDEFNSRFASADEPLAPPSTPTRPRHRVRDSNFVVVALAAIVAVTILVVVAFGFGNGSPDSDATLPSPNTTTQQTVPSQQATKPKKKKPTLAHLVLTAARGDSWMAVRAGGPQGQELYTGTLEQGQKLPFNRRKLWIQLGRPDLVNAKLNGARVGNFPTDFGAIVVVTAKGVRQIGRA